MADYSDLVTATRAVVDPSTSAADLAQIAQLQPSLRPQVAAHPNVYPGLTSWLVGQGVARPITSAPSLPIAPVVSFAPAVASQPVRRRRKTPWMVGIVGVIVVAVVATMLIWQPWKLGGGPQLTPTQFFWMMQNEPSVADTATFQQSSPDAMGTQMTASIPVGLNVYDTDYFNCPSNSDYQAAAAGFLGVLGNHAAVPTGVDMIEYFYNVQDANTVLSLSIVTGSCKLLTDSAYQKFNSITVHGVLMAAYTSSDGLIGQASDSGFGLAQYGNVILAGGMDGHMTWQQWQAQAPIIKAAIDQAAKH